MRPKKEGSSLSQLLQYTEELNDMPEGPTKAAMQSELQQAIDGYTEGVEAARERLAERLDEAVLQMKQRHSQRLSSSFPCSN